jgi:hypothetical protein
VSGRSQGIRYLPAQIRRAPLAILKNCFKLWFYPD